MKDCRCDSMGLECHSKEKVELLIKDLVGADVYLYALAR